MNKVTFRPGFIVIETDEGECLAATPESILWISGGATKDDTARIFIAGRGWFDVDYDVDELLARVNALRMELGERVGAVIAKRLAEALTELARNEREPRAAA